MPRIYTPGRVIQDIKIVLTAQLKQAGTYVGSSNIGRWWMFMIIWLTMTKRIISWYVGENNSKPFLYATKKTTWIDDIMSNDGPLRSDGTQYVTEEMLRNIWNTNDIYNKARIKVFGKSSCWCCHVEKENLKLPR